MAEKPIPWYEALWRVIMHIPIGLLGGEDLANLFIAYEQNQDKVKEDQCHRDLLGGLIGSLIRKVLLTAFAIWVVIKIMNSALIQIVP